MGLSHSHLDRVALVGLDNSGKSTLVGYLETGRIAIHPPTVTSCRLFEELISDLVGQTLQPSLIKILELENCASLQGSCLDADFGEMRLREELNWMQLFFAWMHMIVIALMKPKKCCMYVALNICN